MRRLNEILDEINSTISGKLKYPKAIYYNQADLQVKDDKTFPLVNTGNGKGKQLSLDSRIALQCYHRILSSVTETDPTRGKGKYPYKARIYTIRNVWMGTLKRLPTQDYDSNDDVKNDVYEVFPTVLSQNEQIMTTDENVNKPEIMGVEFANNTIDNLALDVVLFTIDYQIKQNIRCN